METPKLKACLDCIHCKGPDDLFLYCRHPDYSYETKDYIHGKTYTNYPLCVLTRDNEKKCGDEGKGWVEKPVKEVEYHAGLWEAFKGMMKELFGLFAKEEQ
jgi:hypothetical protein